MKKILLLFVLFLFCFCGKAQQQSIDSLQQLLNNAKDDTTKIHQLAQLARAYRDSDPDKSLALAQQGVDLANNIIYDKGEAECYYEIANVFAIRGDFTNALEMHLRALKMREAIKDEHGLLNSYISLSYLYNASKDFKQGLSFGLKANDLSKKVNAFLNETSRALMNTGNAYLNLKNTDSAAFYFNQAYAVAKKDPAQGGLGSVYIGLAKLYSLDGENGLAFQYLHRAENITEQTNNRRALAEAWSNLGSLFHQTGNKDSALYYLHKSFNESKAMKIGSGMLTTSQKLAQLYDEMHNDKATIEYLKIATGIRDSLYNDEKVKQVENLSIAENVRQQEAEDDQQKAEEERQTILQYVAIGFGLIALLILFFLVSRSIIVNERLIKFCGVISLLLVFEFINLLMHPYIGNLTHHSPFWMLLIMVCIAALLIPLHHRLEHWITNILVEKNKQIRLAAAKRTIEQLEGSRS